MEQIHGQARTTLQAVPDNGHSGGPDVPHEAEDASTSALLMRHIYRPDRLTVYLAGPNNPANPAAATAAATAAAGTTIGQARYQDLKDFMNVVTDQKMLKRAKKAQSDFAAGRGELCKRSKSKK